jgi:hypothetical protein
MSFRRPGGHIADMGCIGTSDSHGMIQWILDHAAHISSDNEFP